MCGHALARYNNLELINVIMCFQQWWTEVRASHPTNVDCHGANRETVNRLRWKCWTRVVNCGVCCPCVPMSVWCDQQFSPSQTECVYSDKKKICNACSVPFQCSLDVFIVYNLSYLHTVFGECVYKVCSYNCIPYSVLVVRMNDGE